MGDSQLEQVSACYPSFPLRFPRVRFYPSLQLKINIRFVIIHCRPWEFLTFTSSYEVSINFIKGGCSSLVFSHHRGKKKVPWANSCSIPKTCLCAFLPFQALSSQLFSKRQVCNPGACNPSATPLLALDLWPSPQWLPKLPPACVASSLPLCAAAFSVHCRLPRGEPQCQRGLGQQLSQSDPRTTLHS